MLCVGIAVEVGVGLALWLKWGQSVGDREPGSKENTKGLCLVHGLGSTTVALIARAWLPLGGFGPATRFDEETNKGHHCYAVAFFVGPPLAFLPIAHIAAALLRTVALFP